MCFKDFNELKSAFIEVCFLFFISQLKQYTDDFQKEHTEKEKLKRDNALLHRNQLEAEELLQELNRKVRITAPNIIMLA